jgi:hypothetical protein
MRMTNETTTKIFGVVLLLNIGIAGAWHWFPAAQPAGFAASLPAPPRPSQPPPIQNPGYESSPAPVWRPINPYPSGIVENTNRAASEEAVLTRLREWAGKDPESALAWGGQQPDNQERKEVLADACFQIARTDPRRAVMLAEQFHLNPEAVVENLVQQWAAKDLTAAYNWIAAQPADAQRNALVTGLTFVWSQSEPLNAAQFVVQQMAPGPAQDEAIIMVLHQWALTDRAAAEAWVQQFPESPLRNRALNELAGLAQYASPGPAN